MTSSEWRVFKARELNTITASLLDQYDVIQLDGNVPGGVYMPESIRWIADIPASGDWTDLPIRRKVTRELENATRQLINRGYRYLVLDLNEGYYEAFAALYRKTVATKPRVKKVDIYDQTMSRVKAGYETKLLGIWLGDELQAGLVTYRNKDTLFVTVGAKNRISGVRGGLGAVLEGMLYDYCNSENISRVYHGISTNPAGVVNTAGLFEFKARYGYSALPYGMWYTYFFIDHANWLSDLILTTAIESEIGYLIVSGEKEKQLERKYTTVAVRKLQFIDPTDFVNKYRKALEQLLRSA